VDFQSELTLVQLRLTGARLKLALMEPNTPSDCPYCTRSANEHIEAEIKVLVVLEQLFSGNPISFLSFVKPGPEKLIFAASVMTSGASESIMEWSMARMVLAVKTFAPETIAEEKPHGNPGATALNKFGRAN